MTDTRNTNTEGITWMGKKDDTRERSAKYPTVRWERSAFERLWEAFHVRVCSLKYVDRLSISVK